MTARLAAGSSMAAGKAEEHRRDRQPYSKHPHVTPYENGRAITFRQFARRRGCGNDPAPAGSCRHNNSSATAAAAGIAGLSGAVSGAKRRVISRGFANTPKAAFTEERSRAA
jgi:hypothetical protein